MGQDGDLDRTGLREDLVFLQKEVVAGGEIFDRHAHNPVEVPVDLLDAGSKFLPKHLLFVGSWSDGLGKARGKKQPATENQFHEMGLLTAGIVAARKVRRKSLTRLADQERVAIRILQANLSRGHELGMGNRRGLDTARQQMLAQGDQTG